MKKVWSVLVLAMGLMAVACGGTPEPLNDEFGYPSGSTPPASGGAPGGQQLVVVPCPAGSPVQMICLGYFGGANGETVVVVTTSSEIDITAGN